MAGKNFVGRADDMDIQILGDNKISRRNHCVIVYDEKQSKTVLLPGDSNGIVYLNGEAVYAPAQLHEYDVIEMVRASSCSYLSAVSISSGSRRKKDGKGRNRHIGNLSVYSYFDRSPFPVSCKSGRKGYAAVSCRESDDHRRQTGSGGQLWDLPEPDAFWQCLPTAWAKVTVGRCRRELRMETLKDMFTCYQSLRILPIFPTVFPHGKQRDS